MGHIKEPREVDFIIKSDPLTDEARQEISDFIQSYKKQSIARRVRSTTAPKQQAADSR